MFLQIPSRPLIFVLYAKEYHDFSFKHSCITVPTNFVKELLWFRKFLVSKNIRDKSGGGYHDFPSKLFCLTVLKRFVKEPFCAVSSIQTSI